MTTLRCSVLLLLAACAPEIAPDGTTTDEGPGEGETLTEGGATRVSFDATSEEDWTGYSFTDGVLGVGVPGVLEIQRYRIRLGEGVTAAFVDQPFAQVQSAPSDGYEVDDDPIVDDTSYVFNAWYAYDYETHLLSPAGVTFVVDDGVGLYKVEVEDYYDDAGTPGYLVIRWEEL